MNLLTAAGDLFLGGTCAGCGRAAPGICAVCRLELSHVEPVRVGRDLTGFPQTWSSGAYGGVLRGVIAAYKERGSWGFARPLGRRLATAVAAASLAVDCRQFVLVPLPSSAKVVRERGLDVTRTLALVAARRLRRLGLDVRVVSALRQRPGVRDQTELDADQRWVNVAQGLAVRTTPNRPVLLVDDVATTGATLSAGAATLAAQGALILGAAVVAATTLRIGQSAADPRSPVRTRTTVSTGVDQTLPSPT